MFAQLCENPKFYKKHMMKFVALAPIVSIKNMKGEVLRDTFGNN